MTDRTMNIFLATYITGGVFDWTYWIAVGWTWTPDGTKDHIFPAVLGWIPGIFWPLHVLVTMWNWTL